MTHDTASAVPPQSPTPIEDLVPIYDPDAVDYADVLRKSDSMREPVKFGVGVIMHELASRFANGGAEHGDTLLGIIDGYKVCPTEAWGAAEYLATRCVIELRDDSDAEDNCQCPACKCRRTWVQFPFDYSIDYELAKQDRRIEIERRLANENRGVRPMQSREGMVYLLRSGPRHKIGITTNLPRRMEQLKAQAPFPLEVVHTATGKKYSQMESRLHRDYSECRVHGEWFELSPDQVAAIIESMNEWAAKGGNP